MRLALFAALAAAPLLAACGDKGDDTGATTDGGASDGGATDGGASDGGASDGGSEEPTWADMTREDRQKHMNEVVLPTMTTLFQDFDADAYAGFECATCHGDNFWDASVDYAMPNPANAGYTAVGDGFPGVIDWASADPDYVAYRDSFMYSVVGTMAPLVDQAPYDAKTGEGFGCYGCHPAGG